MAPEVKGGRRNTRPFLAPEVNRGKEKFAAYFFFPDFFCFFVVVLVKSKIGGAIDTKAESVRSVTPVPDRRDRVPVPFYRNRRTDKKAMF